jgi:hypothetical protein
MRRRDHASRAERCFLRSRQSGGFRTWTEAGAERYEKRFSDFRLPKEEKKRTELAETIGADGRRLFEQVCAESRLPWLRELEAIETLRRVWMQHYHASSPSAPRGVRMESCHPSGVDHFPL